MDAQDTRQLSVRFTPEAYEALHKASKRQQRSLNGQVLWYVLEGLRRDGLLIEETPAAEPTRGE
jgi:hypothetical protein